MPSAVVRAVLRTHFPSATVRAAKLAHHQRLLLPTHFQPLRCTHAFCSRPRNSPHPFPVRRRLHGQARWSPAASSPHPFPPFPATTWNPCRPQPSAQFSQPICRPQPSAQPSSLIVTGFFSPSISSHSLAPTPSTTMRALLGTHCPSTAVRAAKLAHHQRLLLPTHFHPLSYTHAVRNCPWNSPSAAVRAAKLAHHQWPSPHPFPATPLHPRRPQPSAQFSAPISRPQPSAQPSSLITNGFFSPISSNSLAPTLSAAVRAVLPTHLPSAAVRAAKLAHHHHFFSLPFPIHFQRIPCTDAVRNRPRSSPHPFPIHSRPRSQTSPLSAPIAHPQPSTQPSSLISGFFSQPISSHSLAPTPSTTVRAILRTHLPSACIRAAKVAHHQQLLLPTHFHPLPCTHATTVCAPLRTHCPSAAVRAAKLAHPNPFPASQLHPRHPQPSTQFSAPISHPQAPSSPAASSPHPFPTTPLHPRRPQPSAHFSAPIARPQPSAQPSSLITSGFFYPPISSLPCLSFPFPSFPLHPRRSHTTVQTSSLPHAVKQLNDNPSIEDAFGKNVSFPWVTYCRAFRIHVTSLITSYLHDFLSVQHAVSLPPSEALPKLFPRSCYVQHAVSPPPSEALRKHFRPISRPQPSAQPSSLITSGSPPISSHSVAPTPSAAVHAVLRTHLPSPPCTHAVRSRPRSSPNPFAVRSRPRSQGRSSPAAFSPPISSHSVAPTPSTAVRAVLRTHFPSAAVRAAKLAHHQRLLLTHFQQLPCTHAVRSRPRSSPHPFAVRSRPRSQARSSPPLLLPTIPHPFPANPLHRRRPQPSTLFSTPIPHPQPSAQPNITTLRTHCPSAAIHTAKLAHQRLLLPTHFQPLPCTHAVHNRPRNSPHPFAVRMHPRSQGRSSPAASSPNPFPPTPLHPRHNRLRTSPHPLPVRSRPRSQARSSQPISSQSVAPTPSAAVHAILRTHFPSASSLITSGFFSPPISNHSVAPTPSAAVRALLRTHCPSAAIRAAKLAHHQRLLLPTHFFPSLPFLSFPFLSLAPTPFAHHRSNQLAPPRG